MNGRLTRILLWCGVCGWGVSILGVLLPWSLIDPMLRSMGYAEPSMEPIALYHFRMATGGWSIIGFFFLMTVLYPRKYNNLIPLLAIACLFEGIVLLTHGLLLKLPPFPFYGDTAFCLVTGAGLLWGIKANKTS